ncbi:basic salivary proline-rich protein 1 [Hylaeus anthracinus]|uniref:basic salivary proline-rich protein 1 n=1 Tax=Hylaeus anthracinus TaxID=313031 RepID=UPI0023B89E58|nr:basic salivary proline-rich protein 1 [Hylaeus anthracinus]
MHPVYAIYSFDLKSGRTVSSIETSGVMKSLLSIVGVVAILALSVTASSLAFDDNQTEAPNQLRERRSPQGGFQDCAPPPNGPPPNGPPPNGLPPCGPPPSELPSGLSTAANGPMVSTEKSRMRRTLIRQLAAQGGQEGQGGQGGLSIPMPGGGGMDMGNMGNMGNLGNMGIPNPMGGGGGRNMG